jgi:hypothetical protein
MYRRALLGIASALLLPISLQAQSESTSSPSPLEVTVTRTGQQKQFVSPFTNQSISVPELSINIRNVSQKCVVGISLRTEDKDSEGKAMATGGATVFRQHNGKVSCLEPGQAFSELDRTNSLDEYGNPSSKKDVTVDFVVFSDGSTWGPGNDSEQKGYLRGKFDAFKPTSQEPRVEEHQVWVGHALEKMEAIKPGMTRNDLLKVFRTEGGLSTGLHRTFVSRDCAFFKVDVEFEAVGRQSRDNDGRVTLEEDAQDVIVKISRPYLQFSIAD